MDYKYVTTYRQIFSTKNVDFCSMMNSKSIVSVFFEMIFNIIRESGLDSILHNCPYNVSETFRLQIVNIALNNFRILKLTTFQCLVRVFIVFFQVVSWIHLELIQDLI